MQPDDDRIPPGQITASIPEAARSLGISEEAVRGRIKRGTLKSVKVGGRTHALLDADKTRPDADRTDAPTSGGSESNALTSALEARIESLERQLEAEREANRENRHIIAALTNRIPQLEAASEPLESPETATQGEEVEHHPSAEEPVRRSFWARLFGG
jgi:hypothetical protein